MAMSLPSFRRICSDSNKQSGLTGLLVHFRSRCGRSGKESRSSTQVLSTLDLKILQMQWEEDWELLSLKIGQSGRCFSSMTFQRRYFALRLPRAHGGVVILFFQIAVEDTRQFGGFRAIGRTSAI